MSVSVLNAPMNCIVVENTNLQGDLACRNREILTATFCSSRYCRPTRATKKSSKAKDKAKKAEERLGYFERNGEILK